MTKAVMVVIDNVHLLADQSLTALLDLWQQPVQLRSQQAEEGVRLVLFLVSRGDLQPISTQRFSKSVMPPWEPSLPLLLEGIKLFEFGDFEIWRDYLTSRLSDLPPWLFDDQEICNMLEECGGIPQHIFEEICQRWFAAQEQGRHYSQYTDDAYRQWLTP